MGLFDTVHDGGGHAQTKALGRSLVDYIWGDHVWLVQPPGHAWRDDDGLERRREFRDFCVTGLLSTGPFHEPSPWVWIVVRGQRVWEIVAMPPDDLPLFGYQGQYKAGPEIEEPLPFVPVEEAQWSNPRLGDPYFPHRRSRPAPEPVEEMDPLDLHATAEVWVAEVVAQAEAVEIDDLLPLEIGDESSTCEYCAVALLRRASQSNGD